MGVTWSNSGLFSTQGFLVSPVGKEEWGQKKKRENKGRRERGNRKGKEGRKEEGIKKRKKDRKEEGFQGERRKEKKKKSFAGFKLVRLVLLVFLCVEREGVVGRIGFTFLPSWATLFAVIQPSVQVLRVLLLPTRPLVHQMCCP